MVNSKPVSARDDLPRPMREAEIMAAARSDPDALPYTAEQIKNARFVPRVKTLRRALRLTQEAFAARYAIPLGTIRGWEQGVTAPDATARAYLRAIAGDADGVAKALTVHQTAE
jgi:putative transcriptional regulator